MRSTFRLLFYINRQKVKANGNCPIMGRITLDGKVCQYSTGEEIAPALWNAEAGRVIVRGKNIGEAKPFKAINTRLDELEQRARLAHVCLPSLPTFSILENVLSASNSPLL
jgi:hypothetical protein